MPKKRPNKAAKKKVDVGYLDAVFAHTTFLQRLSAADG
jgi:hypothetical protein